MTGWLGCVVWVGGIMLAVGAWTGLLVLAAGPSRIGSGRDAGA